MPLKVLSLPAYETLYDRFHWVKRYMSYKSLQMAKLSSKMFALTYKGVN